MKILIIALAFLLVGTHTANAQILEMGTESSLETNTNVNANVNANANVEARANATSTSNRGAGDDAQNSRTASDVSIQAREVRGWDANEKAEFLLNVKSHAELRSGQDLENFAKGVMAADANVEGVDTSEEKVEVRYKLPAKFLGLFGSELSARTGITFESDVNPAVKEVKVNFPWYSMFYTLDSNVRAEALQSAVEASVESDSGVRSNNITARNGRVIQLVSSLLKSIRASVEAEAEVSAEASS